MNYRQHLVSRIYKPNLNTKIWYNNPTHSIDLEKKLSHPSMCVHLICSGHVDITPAFLLQAEKHYNIKPSSLWENIFLMLCGLHISDNFLCAPGGGCWWNRIWYGVFTLVIKSLQSKKSTTYCGLPLNVSGNMTQTSSCYK